MIITFQRGDYVFTFDTTEEALIFISWEYELRPSKELKHIKDTLLDWIRQGVDLKENIWYNISELRKEEKLCQ